LQTNWNMVWCGCGLLLLLIYYLTVWFLVVRAPAAGPIVAQYEPPAGLSPASIRYLLHKRYDDKVLTCTILSLAAKGYLHIRTASGSLSLRRTNSSQESLTPDEQLFGGKLFARHTEVVPQNKNDSSLREATGALRQWLKKAEENRLFKSNSGYLLPGMLFSLLLCFGINGPGRPGFGVSGAIVGLFVMAWSVLLSVIVFLATQLWKSALGGEKVERSAVLGAVVVSLLCVPLAGCEFFGLRLIAKLSSAIVAGTFLAVGVMHFVFYHLLKTPTLAGRRVLSHIEGFRLFLCEVDGDRLNRAMAPGEIPPRFEEYLAYALALDVEQEWAKKFSVDLTNATLGMSSAVYGQANPSHTT